ncbi:MAG: hypothetical protein MOB07_24160 [Acidobacteria bacterium]|nr:hypothetical protein [Acidobacteriota bacterium]
MTKFGVQMLGKLAVRAGDQLWGGPENSKARELFCFLFSHPHSSFSREEIAERLWADCDPFHSKRNLRQVLWKLKSECETNLNLEGRRLVLVQTERLNINHEIDLWIDVSAFEDAYSCLRQEGKPDSQRLCAIKAAVNSYQGDFLPGWYQDWCVYDRERLQNMYMTMLDWLISHSLKQCEYDEGICYGHQLLQSDPASERTHRQLMKLHYLAGDRTTAIRQYKRCVEILREELGVSPELSTIQLYEQLKSNGSSSVSPTSAPQSEPCLKALLPDLHCRLQQFQSQLNEIQQQIQQDIQLVEKMLTTHDKNS